MMGRGIFQGLTILLLVAASSGAQAMDQNGLRRLVQPFMQGRISSLLTRYGRDSRIEFTISTIDPRLNVPDCTTAPALAIKEQAGQSSRLNVQVSCNSGAGWSLFVPVDLAIFRPVVTVINPIARGATIGSADVQLTETDVSSLNGQYLTRLEDAVGMSTKRAFNAGNAVITDQLSQPLLIKRGETVIISAEVDGLSVRMPGVALTDGRRGEQIRVKNSNSAKIVDAQVVDTGLVSAPM
jgi:flagella basal body P-ring formation protein FlgA